MNLTKSALFAASLATLWASSAAAQTTTRDVLGWTSSGLVVVKLTERGERIVDGVSQDYYGEGTEIWGATDKPSLFKHGNPIGPVPDHLASAQEAAVGDKYRTGLVANHETTESPSGTRRIVWHTRQRIDRPDERTFVCRLAYRVLVLDDASRRVYTLHEASASGESSRRQDEAACPKLDISPNWSKDGSGLIFVTVNGETTGHFAKSDTLESKPWASYTPSTSLIATLATGEAAAWSAFSIGAFVEAKSAFEAAGSTGGVALLDAFRGEKKATKAADAAYKASKKTGRDAILRAAAYTVAGKASKATGWIDEAVKGADSYETLLEFAAIFELADPNLANQLAVHALSHPSAADADTTEGWKLLAAGLIDVGEYSKAEESLGNIKTQTPETLALQAEINLDRKQTKQARTFAEDLLFENPGDCRALFLQGRLASADGNNTLARALFEGALSCDPSSEDAAFYVADFARLAGDVDSSKSAFDQYLKLAPARGSDQIRALRREMASTWSERFAHQGVVITDTSCRRGGAGFLCTGTLHNTSSEPTSGDTTVIVRVGRKQVGEAKVAELAAGASSFFGVSFEAKSLKDATISAGRDKKEHKKNEQPVR